MDYRIRIGQEIYSVEATPLDQRGSSVVTAGGRSRRITVNALSPDHLHLLADQRSLSLFVAQSAEGTWVWIEGRARLVQDADVTPRRRSTGPVEKPGTVTPPTPATVVRIMVEAGQSVEKGAPLVVVSAMKMEMTLCAPYAGTVKSVNAAVGAQVSPGDILVDVEESPKEDPHD